VRAHGYLPGPTQRPVTAGLLAGALGAGVALPLLWWSAALQSLSDKAGGQALWLVIATYLTLMAGAGALYGRIFMRAANDQRGGWLFGISYGFLLWMLGPVTLMQWILLRPLLVGGASQGLFASHLLYGVSLGLIFPGIHHLIQRRFGSGVL
jgi:hypothetical protein